MYRRFHDRFGTAGVVIAVIALIAALGGTAFAKGLFTKAQKKKIIAIAKKYAGKPGPAGATGPAGPAGTNGANGETGAAGKSVKATAILVGEAGCSELGGTEFEVEGSGASEEVCNGAEGPPGPIDGVLPKGVTETGVWSIPPTADTVAFGFATAYISYPLRLLAPVATKIYDDGPTVTACTGTTEAPTAPANTLCVYKGALSNIIETPTVPPTPIFTPSYTTGIGVTFKVAAGSVGSGYGTWALTRAP